MTALKAQPVACVHYWVLADPVGETVAGRCRRCRAERSFAAVRRQPEYARTNRKRKVKKLE